MVFVCVWGGGGGGVTRFAGKVCKIMLAMVMVAFLLFNTDTKLDFKWRSWYIGLKWCNCRIYVKRGVWGSSPRKILF